MAVTVVEPPLETLEDFFPRRVWDFVPVLLAEEAENAQQFVSRGGILFRCRRRKCDFVCSDAGESLRLWRSFVGERFVKVEQQRRFCRC